MQETDGGAKNKCYEADNCKKSKIYEDTFAFFGKTNCTRNENFFFFFSFCVDALLGGTFEDIEIRGNQYSVEGECKFEPKLLPIEKVVVIEKKFFISLFYVVNVIACSNIEGPNDVDINTEGTLFSVRIFIVGEFGPAIIPEIWHGPHI